MKYCPKCGKKQVGNPRFCRNCGERLRLPERQAGVILKARRDKKREKPASIKPIENWKLKALAIGHVIAGCTSLVVGILATIFYLNPAIADYSPYEGYMIFLTYILFFLITALVVYYLLRYGRLHEKYLYCNLGICVLIILFSVIFADLFTAGTRVENIVWYSMTSIFLSIPTIASLLILKDYGTVLTIKGTEAKVKGLPKLPTKTLPVELKRDYPVSEYIGEGGFAWVFRVTGKDGMRLAIKIPKGLDAKTGKFFIREVSNWSTLEHDNIVKLHDFNIFPIPYLEMELCDGSIAGGKRNVEEATSIISDVAKGLIYAHEQKIVHGDIKPSNILTKEGKIKISDWGLSKVKRETSISLSGITPQYAAPEQISAEFGRADERTDIYQLGVVFYELVTGRPPFEGEISAIYHSTIRNQVIPPSQINPLSNSIEHIIMKCLSKRKERRYQSMDELFKELRNYEPGSRPPVPPMKI